MREFFRGNELPVAGCSDVAYYQNAEDYFNLPESDRLSMDKLVIIDDDEAGNLTAEDIKYDDEISIKEMISGLFIIRKVTLANVNVEAGSSNFILPYAAGGLDTPSGYELMSLVATHNSERTYCSAIASVGFNGVNVAILNRTGANLGGVNIGYIATFIKNGFDE